MALLSRSALQGKGGRDVDLGQHPHRRVMARAISHERGEGHEEARQGRTEDRGEGVVASHECDDDAYARKGGADEEVEGEGVHLGQIG